jgi:hypothetical protein
MRYREDKPGDLDRARAAVAAWRSQNPGGTCEELIAAIGHRFHPDYGIVLRSLLFAADRHGARSVTGVIPAPQARAGEHERATAGRSCLAINENAVFRSSVLLEQDGRGGSGQVSVPPRSGQEAAVNDRPHLVVVECTASTPRMPGYLARPGYDLPTRIGTAGGAWRFAAALARASRAEAAR